MQYKCPLLLFIIYRTLLGNLGCNNQIALNHEGKTISKRIIIATYPNCNIVRSPLFQEKCSPNGLLKEKYIKGALMAEIRDLLLLGGVPKKVSMFDSQQRKYFVSWKFLSIPMRILTGFVLYRKI